MMHESLTAEELRVLGCLIEKEISTPSAYPLTLNALTNACNQKSNRAPVMNLDEKTVVRALDSLTDKKLANTFHGAGSRVAKYKHRFREMYETDDAETAVLCELMLRGPQTGGELRSRANRLHAFDSLEAVEETLNNLAERDHPLVTLLPRQPGRKESRYTQLLSEAPEPDEADVEPAPEPEPARQAAIAEDERFARIEQELETLRNELEELRNQFLSFRKEFE